MLRDHQKPLRFPLLIEAETPENADGEIGFPPGTLFKKVRAVQSREIKQRLNKTFPGKGRELFDGLDLLRFANENWRDAELARATAMVRPWVLCVNDPRFVVTEPYETRWGRARWDYASLLSNALINARLVAWWRYDDDRWLAPAVYCPDWQTVSFAALWIGAIRICPKCKRPFVPPADNRRFCCPEHGAAYRTQQSRNKKNAA